MNHIDLATDSLSLHPSLELIPMLPDVIAGFGKRKGKPNPGAAEAEEERRDEWAKFVESVRAHGILTPLTVCKDGDQWLVIDGRHRLFAARAAALLEVPCIVRDAADADDIIREALVVRRHTTKLQIGLVAIETAEMRDGAGRPKKTALSAQLPGPETEGAKTASDLAQTWGISVRYIMRLKAVRSQCTLTPEKWEWVKRMIWRGDGFTEISKFIVGSASSASGSGVQPRWLDSVQSQAEEFASVFGKRWASVTDEAERSEAVDQVSAELAKIPLEALTPLIRLVVAKAGVELEEAAE